jgi:hypothetical protein
MGSNILTDVPVGRDGRDSLKHLAHLSARPQAVSESDGFLTPVAHRLFFWTLFLAGLHLRTVGDIAPYSYSPDGRTG